MTDNAIYKIANMSVVVGAVFFLVLTLNGGIPEAWGVLLGVAIFSGNLVLLDRVFGVLMTLSVEKRAILLCAKFLCFFVGVFSLLKLFPHSHGPFLLGLAIPILVIVLKAAGQVYINKLLTEP